MALGFNTGIEGITSNIGSSTISGGISNTNISKAPDSVKKKIQEEITNKEKIQRPSSIEITASNNPIFLGGINKIKSDEKNVGLASIELAEAASNGQPLEPIYQKYSSMLNTESLDDAISMSIDIKNGSGLDELNNYYGAKGYSKDIISKVYGGHKLINEIYNPADTIQQEYTTNTKEGSAIKDMGEGVVSFAGGIPKFIAGLGLLDKPADWLVENIVNPLRVVSGKEALDINAPEYEKFSQYVKGSQVGGDPESKTAKTTESVLSAIELVTGIPMLIKGATKMAAKQATKEAVKMLDKAKTGEKVINNKVIKRVWNAIQPKETPTVLKGAGKILKGEKGQAVFGRKGGTLFGKPTTIPKKSNIGEIKTAINAGITGKEPIEQQGTLIAKSMQKNAKRADSVVKKFNTPIDENTIKSEFDLIEEVPSDITPDNKLKVQNIFMKIFNNQSKDLAGLHKARQVFYADNKISKILNGVDSDLKDYVKAIGGASRDIISKKSPEYAKLMKEESNLFKIMANISTKFDNMSKFKRFINSNESLLKTAGYGLGFGYAGYEGVKYISGN